MSRQRKDNPIKAVFSRYLKWSLWIIAGCALLVLAGMSLKNNTSLLNALIVTVLFSIVSSIAYGLTWKWVKMKAPDKITFFHLAAPFVRMVLAALVVLVWCLNVKDTTAIKAFALLFFAFYLILLIFDCIFFARHEKKLCIDAPDKQENSTGKS